ncbi:oligopeptide transport system permease protein OppC [Anaerolineaceae bacterium]|nr:oligopeptide transport system permease protein OppC [Anaerolineaceae bacterium]
MVVWAAFAVPRLIIAEAILGYLGLGLRPSITGKEFFVTSWGRLFLEAYSNVASQPDFLLVLSLVVSVFVISFTFLGDGLRDALDPRQKR